MRIKTKISISEAVATLVGTIIGAGILGVPFVIAQVGAGPGFFLLIALGLAALLKNLMVGEIILRTRMRHQLPGYVKKYLGKPAYFFEIASMLIGSFGALVAYLIGEGEILAALFGGSKFLWSLLFFAFGALILYFGLKVIKVFELWLVMAFLVIILIMIGLSSSAVSLANLQYMDWTKLFLPYGVILFAYGGAAAIIPLRQILKGRERHVKKAILIGSIIPMVIYAIFAIAVIGVTGRATSEVATIGLGNAIGPYMLAFGNLFAFFAMGTSFLTIGVILKEFFQFDFKLPKWLGWLIVSLVPLVLFLAGARSFIQTMGIAGSLTFGLSGILTTFAFWRAKKRGDREPEFVLPKFKMLGILLMIMFAVGVVYTVWDIIK